MAERDRLTVQQLITVDGLTDLDARLDAAGVSRPRPVLVLIGGAAKLADGDGRLDELVREGIVRVAERARASIIDGGTDAGVMAMAGRARRELDAKLNLIGVAPRGRVTADGVDGAGDTALEPNHTHVVLTPGDDWGAELPWLIETARVVSAGKSVVAVLVDGGPLAIAEATKCLAQGWPLVTIAGSGRAADDLATVARSNSNPLIHVTDVDGGAESLAATLKRLLESPPPAPAPSAGGTARPKIEYPALYTAASEASKRGQRLYKLLVLAELLLALVGLVVSVAIGLAVVLRLIDEATTPTDLPPGIPPPPLTPPGPESFVALAVASTFLAAFVIKFLGRSAGYDEDWFIGRAVAETAKSNAWRYMMRVPPYGTDDADRQFSADLSGLARRARDIRQAIDRLPARPQQISASMRKVRELELPARRDFYVAWRLIDQADWYGRRGAGHRRRASRWFWLGVASQLVAAGIALYALRDAGQTPLLLRFMSLFASLAIFFTAWSQLNRDDELAKSYASALQELIAVADSADTVTTERSLAALVDRGEEAIGRENRVWVAKRADKFEPPDFERAD